MPTYEYRCSKCGEDLEVYQTFSEEPLKKHAVCGGKLTRVFSPVGIVLKGSGFYKNDSRKGGSGSGDTKPDATKSDTPAKVDTAPKADGTPKRDSSSPASTPSTASTPAAKSA
jgi:putative FmdB family regulatory protein